MSDTAADRFNQFYKDFYAGRIDFGDYRYRRGLILDTLGDPPQAEEPALDTLPRDAREPEVQVPETPPAPSEPKKERAIGLPVVIVVSLVVVVTVVFFVLRQISRTEPDLNGLAREVPSESVPDLAAQMEEEQEVVDSPPPVPDPGQRIVEDFVERQDWRRMSVQQFQDEWGRLSAADRIVAKGAVWFQPMTESLRDQIDEASAIAVNPADDRQLDSLYELSLRLGLVELVPPGWTPKVAAPQPVVTRRTTAKQEPAPEPQPETAAPTGVSEAKPAENTAQPEAPAAVADKPKPKSLHECSAEQLKTRRRNCYDLVSEGVPGPLLKVLPAGEFMMGDGSDAAPSRSTAIENPFAISIFEITHAQFQLFCTQTGRTCPASPWSDPELPVVDVNFHDAAAYCNWLSDVTGQRYRLPTEEEWEYAARAGTTTTYPYGDRLLPAQARYSSVNDYDEPLPISDDTTQKNKFGLWHVIGNVAEWVGADGDKGIVRGGAYSSREDELASAARVSMPLGEKNKKVGFRLVREL